MDPIKKGNLLVILTITIIAFGTSTAVASFTSGDVILGMLNITINNESTELIAVADGNFTALTANQAVIQVQNVTNATNTTNDTNTTRNITNRTPVVNNNE